MHGEKIKKYITYSFRDFRLRLHVIETCPLFGFYAAWNGSLLPTFRDKLTVPYSEAKQSEKFCWTAWLQTCAELILRAANYVEITDSLGLC